jgi:prepilin-type N-terminal cleavage/methylation domain-containing protein
MRATIKNINKQKGFTLVELAIVLVIIGLIVSSVLVGQDLIKAAQLRATVRQLNEFQVGVNTFIGKYNGVPGDITAASATNFGLTGSGIRADGDGTIESEGGGIADYSGEIVNFWSHLSSPGRELIAGTYRGVQCGNCTAGTNFPAMKFGGAGWGAYGVSGQNYFYAGAASPNTGGETTMANPFIPVDAFNIDSKIDDGLPNTGDVMAGGNVLTNFVATLVPSTNATTGCAVGTGTAAANNIYKSINNSPACGLRFKMQTF